MRKLRELEISIGKLRESRDFNRKVKRKYRFQSESSEKVEISIGKLRQSRDFNRKVKRKSRFQ